MAKDTVSDGKVALWTLRKEFRFEAAHKLAHHDGKCARLHGHSWKLVVEVAGAKLQADGPKRGMLMDFGDLKAAVAPLVEGYLDHHYLNETLGTDSPTSEYVAAWASAHLVDFAEANGLTLAVQVEETCTSACRLEWRGR